MVRCLPTAGRSGAVTGEITSIYATQLGTIALTWSRDSIGIFLTAELRLSPPADNENSIDDHVCIRLRPYLPWNRKGSKHQKFTTAAGSRREVELSWDLSLASFSRSRGPEPTAGFFVSIAVDGEIAHVVGDREEEAYLKGSEMISRRERMKFGGIEGEMSYATKVRFEGKEMAISILVDLEREEMSLEIDGENVLEVRRLCWKFRGRDWVTLKSGGRIDVSWDLHDWFFEQKAGREREWAPAAGGEPGYAVFLLQFRRGVEEKWQNRKGGGKWFWEGGRWCFWKRDWSESSSGSPSGWSSGSSSSVEELEYWEEEEVESAGDGGFTLLVRGRKG